MLESKLPHAHLYVGEIEFQCSLAIQAWNELKALDLEADQIQVWMLVQSMLIACANVSKLLWSDIDEGQRGAQLRCLLDVGEGSALASRRLRNEFEHFDERLDRWAKRSPGQRSGFVDRSVEVAGKPVARILSVNGEPIDCFRRLEHDWTVSCLGRSMRLDRLALESTALREQARRLLSD
jgi:hypothetical protein